jgi:hypothetical protein
VGNVLGARQLMMVLTLCDNRLADERNADLIDDLIHNEAIYHTGTDLSRR